MKKKNPEIFYHEDFNLQIELIPAANYFEAQSDIERYTTEFNPFGFVTITERSAHSITTESLKISVNSIQNALSPFTLEYFPSVTTGYSNTIERKKNTVALGFERLALFLEVNDQAVIKNIWLCQSPLLVQDSYCHNLFQALTILGKDYDFILVDWEEEVVIRLASSEILQNYLMEVFGFKFITE